MAICYEVIISYHRGCNYGYPTDYAPYKTERRYVKNGAELISIQHHSGSFISVKPITAWKIKNQLKQQSV